MMAGDWIPMRVDLADDPAVIAIAASCELDENTVIGCLFRLWSWANRQLSNGHASVASVSWIDRYVGVTGFADAMSNAGWLSITKAGVSFPNYDRWNSKGAKNRLLSTQRKQIERSQKCHDADATKTRQEKRREEKRREKKENPLTPLPDDAPWTAEVVPLPNDDARFEKAWTEWTDSRKSKGKPVTNRIARLTIEKLKSAGLTIAEAAECVFESAANGWQGVFPDRIVEKRQSPKSKPPPVRFPTRSEQESADFNERMRVVNQTEKELHERDSNLFGTGIAPAFGTG